MADRQVDLLIGAAQGYRNNVFHGCIIKADQLTAYEAVARLGTFRRCPHPDTYESAGAASPSS